MGLSKKRVWSLSRQLQNSVGAVEGYRRCSSVLPGVCPTDVGQPGLPGSGGLQQVQAGVDVGPDPLWQHLGVLCGH